MVGFDLSLVNHGHGDHGSGGFHGVIGGLRGVGVVSNAAKIRHL